ncbi:MAG TPA: permease [Candidatus Omnitrophota bacterium]|nr:permease [Candidatus Omnitrophota bacterium]
MATLFWLKLQLFSLFSVSVFLEAAPFLLLGALLSALFEVLVPEKTVTAWIPKKRRFGLLLGLTMGMIFPTCECGIIPIIKRMIEKKVPNYIAITYLLAAPVINPVVLFSTYVAFRGNWHLVLARIAIVSLVALLVGSYFALTRERRLLKADPKTDCDCGCGHDHHVEHDHHHEEDDRGGKIGAVLAHTADEFLEMGKYLIVGCFAASFFTTFFPKGLLPLFETNLLLSIVFMMGLAILLSICAAADSFIAASFTGMPAAAQTAFVTLGPMFDLKLLSMYLGVFKRKYVWRLALVIVGLNFILNCLLGVIVR